MITMPRSYVTIRTSTVAALLRRAWHANRALTFVGVVMLATLAAALVGIAVDPRVITGAPAWLKPAKFAISVSIYAFTLLWLLSFVSGHPRLVSVIANASALLLGVEMIIIVGQAARGTTSHFNVATPFDGMLWSIMGMSITVVWVMGFLTAGLLLFQRLPSPVFAWSLRLGMLLALIGMGLAFMMTGPTAAQQAQLAAGQTATIIGAHSVGVADGGPGLPFVGWSTVGGDLRIAHFVGLHAMQMLPLLGWLLLSLQASWLRRGHRVALVWTAGGAYLGLMLLLAWQAQRGQPLIAPDALTWSALAGLIAATGVITGAIVLHARSTRSR